MSENIYFSFIAAVLIALAIGGAWGGFALFGDHPVDMHLLIHGEVIR